MVSLFRVKSRCFPFIIILSAAYLLHSFFFFEHQIPEYAPVQRHISVNVIGVDGVNSTKTQKWSISDQFCKIPKLDINNTEITPFFREGRPLDCEDNQLNWLFINDNGEFELIPGRKKAKCRIGYILRKNDNENILQDVKEVVREGEKMRMDFGRVHCVHGKQLWTGLLMSVAKNETARKIALKQKDNNHLNVYILGFDSLSQMSFRRNLPKTVDYLENDMEAVVLDGYNIVGDGTPQAFIPILTGQTEVELPLTRKRYKEANYVDDVYPFIWNNFSAAGYVTLYAEDAFQIGTFSYRLKGFRNQPTDHFTRTFFKENEKKLYYQWNCLGSEPLHKSWFRYSREFMRVYSDVPRFLLMHQSLLSHDDINQVKVEDTDIYEHLKSMTEAGEFDNSLVIVMADHGHRFAQLRSTHQGQLEERLPFVSLFLPKKFRETRKGAQIYENLKINKNRLATPFDLHATLLDVLDPPSMSALTRVQDVSKRSLSLFRAIPVDRSCSHAGIDPHWCTCLNWKIAEGKDREISMKLANIVVDTFNDQLKNVTNLCAKLHLKEILSSKKLIPNEDLLKYKNTKDLDGFIPDLSGETTISFTYFQLKLSTTPGRAIYEITLLYDIRKKKVDIDLNSISHVNKYGNDAHCIIDSNYFLATYCVCHDRI